METLIGPTLLDRATYIGTTLTDISPVFFIRGVGYIAGSTLLGALSDRFKQHTCLFLCVALVWSAIGELCVCATLAFDGYRQDKHDMFLSDHSMRIVLLCMVENAAKLTDILCVCVCVCVGWGGVGFTSSM